MTQAASGEQLQQSKAWTTFVQALNNKETFDGYTSDLRQYLRFLKIEDPDKLLVGAPETQEDLVISFIMDRKAQATSAPRIRRIVASIKLFYEVNRHVLNWKFVTRKIGKTRAVKDSAYTHGDIKKALEFATLRERVIILLLVSSGVRRGALPDLELKHLQPIDKYGIFKITVYEGDEEQYITYSTPECRKAVEEYLAYRQRCGEKISPESPIVRDEFNRDDIDRARFPKPLGADTLTKTIIDAMEKAGVRHRMQMTEGQKIYKVRHPVKAVHGLRKFWDTQMTLAGVSPLWIELLEGHKIRGMKYHYLRPTDGELLEGSEKMSGYVAAIDRLTIADEHRFSKEVSKLTEKLKDAPKLEVLQQSIVSRELEMDAIKKELKKEREEREKLYETLYQKGIIE